MADITMCGGEGCLKRENCYRYRANPSTFWQSYFSVTPWKMYEGKQVCTHQWPMNEEEEQEDDQTGNGLRSHSV